MLAKLSLRLRVFLFFGALGIGVLGVSVLGLWVGYSRVDPAAPLSGWITAGLVSGFLSLGLVLFVWRLFDENVARAIEKLAAEMRARAHAAVDHDIDHNPARFLGDLAPAASAVTENLTRTKGALDQTVAERTEELNTQSSRLMALLSDIQTGLLVCSPSHQLVFYNGPSIELLSDTGRPRLDRSIFDLLRAGPIKQTYARLLSAPDGQQDAELLVSTTRCAKSLAAHMRLFSGALGIGETPGYVLTLRDVTADLALHTRRERMLAETIAAVRQPAGNLKTMLEVRTSLEGEAGAADRASLDAAIMDEARALTGTIQTVSDEFDASLTTWWPMQDVRAADLIDGLRGHLSDDSPALDAPPVDLVLRCDGYAIVALLGHLIDVVTASAAPPAVTMTIAPDEEGALIRITWPGTPLDLDEVERALAQPIDEAADAMTGREVLDRHGSDVWPVGGSDGKAALILPVREARAEAPVPPPKGHIPERPTVFDFSLLKQRADGAVSGRPLSELTYVVFDTETTGLDPHGGDEIVQIAAVRLLNGRRVDAEVLDTLVDPGRPIPPASTAVHKIDDTMVQGAPDIAEAGARFHRFADKAVLVAHNAPFDMAFFHRHAKTIGAEFDHPVLDTVLLSAILFGQSAEHTLDALATRFGVVIPEEDRHTAIGDTIATAEVFQKMLPMLEAQGMGTYDEVLAEMQRNNRLLREMKARVGAPNG